MVASYPGLTRLRFSVRLDEDGREFIAHAIEGVVRMQSLIDDLLTYFGIGSGNPHMVRPDCEVALSEALAGESA